MEKKKLGQSDLKVSVLALGTWAMGGAQESWGSVDDRESIAAIHQAVDSGINLIDTAPIYGLGHSEEILGKAIQGRRHEVLIATKCGILFPRSTAEQPKRCLTRESVLLECEQSLRRMRIEVIDIYQCHWPDPATPIRETMSALNTLREQGKIRAVGLSNFSCEEIAAALEFGPIHALQSPFSLLQPRASEDLIPFCMEHNIAVLPYSPLAKGLLTGTVSATDRFAGIRARDPDFLPPRLSRHLQTVDGLREIAARHAKTVGQLVLNWTTTVPGVTSPIFGARRPSQVIENVGAAGWRLSEDDQAEIGRLMRGSGDGL